MSISRRDRANVDPPHAITLIATPLWILAAMATALFLRETRELFVPIALALLVSYACDPAVRWLARIGVRRPFGAALVVALILGLGGLTAWGLSDDFVQGARHLPEQVREIRRQLQSSTTGGTLDRLREAAREAQGATRAATSHTPVTAQNTSASEPAGAMPTSGANTAFSRYLWQGSSSLITIAGQITVMVFLLYFLLVESEAWRTRLLKLSGEVLSSRRAGAEVLNDINWQVQRFLLVRLATSAGVAVATWIALRFFDAPAPALWGAAAGVFNSVPYFGPIIVSTGLAIVGLVSGGVDMALQLAGVALVITTLEGWLITPPLLGRAARMNTLAVFLSLLFWSWVWGVWGTILAVPLMAIVKAISDHVEPLDWLARLLADEGQRAEGTGQR